MFQQLCRLFAGVLLVVFFGGCQKPRTNLATALNSQPLILAALHYFEDSVASQHSSAEIDSTNLRLSTEKTPQWASAFIFSTSVGPAVIVPVAYNKELHIRSNFSGKKLFDLNELTRLFVYKDAAHHYHAELVTIFPDSADILSTAGNFSGLIFVETWVGQRLRQYKCGSDGSALRFDAGGTQQALPKSITTTSSPIPATVGITTCYEIDGYNYTSDDPDEVYTWSEPAGCTYQYLSETGSGGSGLSGGDYGGGGGAGSTTSPQTVVVTGGTNPISNIAAYLQCFTNSTAIDHSYSVTLCVSQPVPGTRDPWGYSEGGSSASSSGSHLVNVGHTWVVMSENNAGNIITRNVGFYPVGAVTPRFPSDQGELDDNEQTGYNIAVTYTVSNLQFFSMLNYIAVGNNPGYLYDLYSNNCTTFALHTLSTGGINIPTQQGTWGGDSGDDPGDLGQDLRSLSLPTGASLSTVNNPHPNQGSCN